MAVAEAKQETKAQPAPKKREIYIDPGRMQLSEFARQDWVANAPEGATPEDIKNPAFWMLMSQQMKPYDRVEVRADDGTWLAEVLVLEAERTYARVSVLNVFELDSQADTQVQTDFEVFWRGPQHKWSVKRTSDNEVVKSGLSTRSEGISWLAEYRKAL